MTIFTIQLSIVIGLSRLQRFRSGSRPLCMNAVVQSLTGQDFRGAVQACAEGSIRVYFLMPES
jgi:hypothetical protein